MIEKLNAYYQQCGIHPLNFHCPFAANCRGYADKARGMTEAKMSMAGAHYGDGYPRIVVVSLDPPAGGDTSAEQRTSAYFQAKPLDDFSVKHPNPHWANTLIVVKDILTLFGYRSPYPKAAIVQESYVDRPIDNVEPYFAHVNLAKCSANYPGHGQARRAVHRQCGNAYLENELAILQPQILITQGAAANDITSRILSREPFSGRDLPATRIVDLGGKTLWLLMPHPTRLGLAKTRRTWPDYVRAIKLFMPLIAIRP